MHKKATLIAEYLYKNYYNDAASMSKIPIISALIANAAEEQIPSLIDKVAVLSGIKKSSPPDAAILA